jgi:hypothetical protein
VSVTHSVLICLITCVFRQTSFAGRGFIANASILFLVQKCKTVNTARFLRNYFGYSRHTCKKRKREPQRHKEHEGLVVNKKLTYYSKAFVLFVSLWFSSPRSHYRIFDGVLYQFCAVLYVELFHHSVFVESHRTRRHIQDGGNFLHRTAFSQ